MMVERALLDVVEKPWGSVDLRPWSDIRHGDAPIGEIWFRREHSARESPKLLLKLLFTSQPLSIQVHPGDRYARAIGQANGKTEAWYILDAAPDARVAVGLKRRVTKAELRAAIENGAIVDLVRWRAVAKGDVVFIPAGTIHAIGAGLVIAEIQQRSDATFRIFDFDRHRELDVERALAVAFTRPAGRQHGEKRVTPQRTLLVDCPQFALESLELPALSKVALPGGPGTWLFVREGEGQIGDLSASPFEALYLDSNAVDVTAGAGGLKLLVARPGPEQVAGLVAGPAGQWREPASIPVVAAIEAARRQ